MHIGRLLFAALAAIVMALGVVAAPASAQGGDAKVRVAHFSPDAPNVDVYVDGNRALSGVAFNTVSDYVSLPAGQHSLEVRPAGAAPSSAAVISARPDLAGGAAYTVAAVGKLAEIKGQIYTDDLSSPAAGKAKVRVIHAAPDVPAVDVAVKGGPVLFSNASFPNATPYAEVPAGSYDIEVRRSGTQEVLLSANGVSVNAGNVYSVAATGGAGKPVGLKPIVDATGVARAPHGGVATGAGGTAETAGVPTSALPALTIATIGAALVAVGGAFSHRRRACSKV